MCTCGAQLQYNIQQYNIYVKYHTLSVQNPNSMGYILTSI